MSTDTISLSILIVEGSGNGIKDRIVVQVIRAFTIYCSSVVTSYTLYNLES